jgi:hypothetical protein
MTNDDLTQQKIEKVKVLLDSLEQQIRECKAILRGEKVD